MAILKNNSKRLSHKSNFKDETCLKNSNRGRGKGKIVTKKQWNVYKMFKIH
jgi:hypothetical protein